MPTKPRKAAVATAGTGKKPHPPPVNSSVRSLSKKRKQRNTSASLSEIDIKSFFLDGQTRKYPGGVAAHELVPSKFITGSTKVTSNNKHNLQSLVFADLEDNVAVLSKIRSRQCSFSSRVTLRIADSSVTLEKLEDVLSTDASSEMFSVATMSVIKTDKYALKQLKIEVVIKDAKVGPVEWKEELVTLMFLQKGSVSVSGITVKAPQMYTDADLHQISNELAQTLVSDILSTVGLTTSLCVTSNVMHAVFSLLPHSILPSVLKEHIEDVMGPNYIDCSDENKKDSFWVSLDSSKSKRVQISTRCETMMGCTVEPAKLYSSLWFLSRWLHEVVAQAEKIEYRESLLDVAREAARTSNYPITSPVIYTAHTARSSESDARLPTPPATTAGIDIATSNVDDIIDSSSPISRSASGSSMHSRVVSAIGKISVDIEHDVIWDYLVSSPDLIPGISSIDESINNNSNSTENSDNNNDKNSDDNNNDKNSDDDNNESESSNEHDGVLTNEDDNASLTYDDDIDETESQEISIQILFQNSSKRRRPSFSPHQSKMMCPPPEPEDPIVDNSEFPPPPDDFHFFRDARF